jgi:hypothetical protein
MSGHGRTLHKATEHPLASRFAPVRDLKRAPNLRFAFLREGDSLRVEIGDGERSAEIPLEWAFGSGTHGVSFVSNIGGGLYLEHAFSYYTKDDVFDLTPGHRDLPAGSLMEGAGQVFRAQGGRDIRGCFRCHSTGAIAFSSRQEIQVAEQGVRCEACHGPGRAHAVKPDAGSIRNPRSLPAEDQLRFCGSCHRPPGGSEASNDFANPWNVRHQPPYLEQSACFQKSGGALSCVTCHPPHEPIHRADPVYYREKCSACHNAEQRPPAALCAIGDAPDCTRCHMPAVQPDPRLEFRNHWIGVYRDGAPLIPIK